MAGSTTSVSLASFWAAASSGGGVDTVRSDTDRRIADLASVDGCFGRAEWKEYFGVDVGPVPELPEAFYAFWRGPDPLDPTQTVSATHFEPVWCPESVTDSTGATNPYSLGLLGRLVETAPKESSRSRYAEDGIVLHPHSDIAAGPGAWLVMKRKVLGIGLLSYEHDRLMRALNTRTAVGYNVQPSVVHLATVVFARYAQTGERVLGDETGLEGRATYSRCKMTVISGKNCRVMIGHFGHYGLMVDGDFGGGEAETIGVAAVRTF